MSKKLSPNLKPATMDYVVEGITHVCKTFKRRTAGSQSERDSQDYFAKELEQWSDNVITEDFKLNPLAFMGFIPAVALIGIFDILLFGYNYFNPSFTLSLITMIVMVFLALTIALEFLLYRQFVDFLFPKAVSKNTYAVRKPTGETKRRIIFGGHADAAFEWIYFLHGQMKAFVPTFFGSIAGILLTLIAMIAYLIMGTPPIEGFWLIVMIVLLAFIPSYIGIMVFVNWKVIVDGANDNLTACYASMAIMKEMAENDFRFEHTEVCCLITGSEEAGLRGAKAFCKKHIDELKNIETIFIPFEVLREREKLTAYSKDLNATVTSNKSVTDLLIAAAKKVDVDLKCAPIPLGSTDAAAFVQAGIAAVGVCGSDDSPQTYYHTRFDSYDNISPDCIQKAIELGYEAAYMFDAEGLK